MTREAEAEGDRRMTAIGGNDDARGNRSRAGGDADGDADDRPPAPRLTEHRAPHGDAGLELAAGGYRLLQQHPIEIAPHDRAARLPARIATLDDDAPFAGEPHAAHGKGPRVEAIVETKPRETRQRAGIHRVAAQLVARKCGALDQSHARTSARQDDRGDRPGRPRADDHDIRLGQ